MPELGLGLDKKKKKKKKREVRIQILESQCSTIQKQVVPAVHSVQCQDCTWVIGGHMDAA